MKTSLFLKRISRIIMWLITGLLVLATVGAIYQALSTRSDLRNYPALGQLVDVGGFNLHIYCVGENVKGSPTVILEQGLGGTSVGWARVQPEIAKSTRVCAYDRAGMGWSDSGSEPRDGQHIATELHTLLRNADIPGPYVLVGWSFGGLYVRIYAAKYPTEVSGIVLLDSSHTDQWTSTAAGKSQFESNAGMYKIAPWLARIGVMRVMGAFQQDPGLPTPQNETFKAFFAATKDWDAQSAEFLASPATNNEARNLTSLDAIPLYVLTATEHGMPPEQEQLWQDWQNELALLSTNSVHQIVPEANHASFWLDPETAKISVEKILNVVEAAQTGERVQP